MTKRLIFFVLFFLFKKENSEKYVVSFKTLLRIEYLDVKALMKIKVAWEIISKQE